MNNWDARMEEGTNCTLAADFESVEKTCRIVGIDKVHRLNFQSSYWQRVFTPVLTGYQSGNWTPNPDVLCNREIKFGELFEWAIGGGGTSDLLATGHYARINVDCDNRSLLRQARDLNKDQTYFLGAVDRKCLERTIFPLGNLMKTHVKIDLVLEAGLKHLIDRKESMGMCFIGKRRKFQDFIDEFGPKLSVTPGSIVCLETGNELVSKHKGLSFYTIGQNVSISGSKTRLYVAGKDLERNSLQVVNSLNHPSLWKNVFTVTKWSGFDELKLKLKMNGNCIYCSIRSVDKTGVRVKSFEVICDDKLQVYLEDYNFVFAPCPGQWAMFYAEDDKSETLGRICLGGSQIETV